MSTEARRTLVVDLDQLEQHRDGLRRHAAQVPAIGASMAARADAITGVIRMGTTVPLDHLIVVQLATPVRETPWQRAEQEQERFYSEAHAVDADWTPAGGAA